MSINNLDFDFIGRTVVALVIMTLSVFAACGLHGLIERLIKQHRAKVRKALRAARPQKEEAFFFGPVSDWSEWK